MEILSIMVGIAWWQDCEAGGHITSIVTKQRQAIFTFVFSLGPQHVEWPTLKVILLTSVSTF